MALLGPREMSDLSPQSGPKRTLIQGAVTNRDFMSTRPSAGSRPGGRPEPVVPECLAGAISRRGRTGPAETAAAITC